MWEFREITNIFINSSFTWDAGAQLEHGSGSTLIFSAGPGFATMKKPVGALNEGPEIIYTGNGSKEMKIILAFHYGTSFIHLSGTVSQNFYPNSSHPKTPR